VIENLSYEKDLVVDTFLGSGTSAVAAKRLNRRFVGCDEDEASVSMTLARLAQEPEQ
jgi:DNA modification methylase